MLTGMLFLLAVNKFGEVIEPSLFRKSSLYKNHCFKRTINPENYKFRASSFWKIIALDNQSFG
ncbi:hypothetical protein A130_11955 [Vibrio genomosp. F6 str. FF-238]|uniref:Uncharacterized protein n=1 Tax=Vibrio genomosp. F6 str. FF-238 TaxID=1191298 RepID=A0A1E5D6J2_9VIBR|nr:hypothetical protein A130_11955 [Vibrio genomosp. F6 str. FF-238]